LGVNVQVEVIHVVALFGQTYDDCLFAGADGEEAGAIFAFRVWRIRRGVCRIRAFAKLPELISTTPPSLHHHG
jgi:hypothetical protein